MITDPISTTGSDFWEAPLVPPPGPPSDTPPDTPPDTLPNPPLNK